MKEKISIRKRINEDKTQFSIFIITYLTDNDLFQIIIASRYMMIITHISEINDNKNRRNGREKLRTH